MNEKVDKDYILKRNCLIPQAASMTDSLVSQRAKGKWAKVFMRNMILLSIDHKLCHPACLELFDSPHLKGCSNENS